LPRQRWQRRGTKTAASRRGGRGEGAGVHGLLLPILSSRMRSLRGGRRRTPHVFSRGSRQAGSRGGGPSGPRGTLLRDRFRLAAAAMMTMTGDDDDNGGGHRGQIQNTTIN
jgi:hypothetical protein